MKIAEKTIMMMTHRYEISNRFYKYELYTII